MKRISELFMVICFLGILISGAAFTVLRQPAAVSYYEFRMLANFPVLTPETIGDGSFTTELERYLEDHAALRTSCLQWKVHMDLALHRPVINDIVITPKRLLPFLSYESPGPDTIASMANDVADRISQINDTVTAYGGYYCHVAIPCQYVYFEDEYPWFLNNRSEMTRLSVATFSQALEQRGVPLLDMGAVFDSMGHPEEFGSQVDNHFTMIAAFETYQRIMEKAAAESGLEFPILGLEDVTFEPVPDEYLGAWERRLMELVSRDEQLFMVLPKEPVPYTRTSSWEFEHSVYKSSQGEYSPQDYNFYMGGDYADTIISTNREELPSILIYGDSFTNPLECVTYLSFNEMHALDLRYYNTMSLDEYIQTYRPDIVVCIRDYDALLLRSGNGGGY